MISAERMKSRASVIVVSWNCKGFLLKCLESMLSQTCMSDVEWIVVDNASTDGTAEEVKNRYPSVILLENSENLGFARANNQGIMKSSGKYIFLVNPDVEFKGDSVGELCRFLDQNGDIGICGPRILNIDGTLQPSCKKFPTIWNNLCFAFGLHRMFPKTALFSATTMSYFAHDTPMAVDALAGCFLAVRREAMEEVGPLDEDFFMYSEDIDWCKRFRDSGWKIVLYPSTEVVHYGGGSSENAPIRYAIEQERAYLLYWAKHHGAWKTTVVRATIAIRHFFRVIWESFVYLFLPTHRKQTATYLRQNIACIREALTFETGTSSVASEARVGKSNE